MVKSEAEQYFHGCFHGYAVGAAKGLYILKDNKGRGWGETIPQFIHSRSTDPSSPLLDLH